MSDRTSTSRPEPPPQHVTTVSLSIGIFVTTASIHLEELVLVVTQFVSALGVIEFWLIREEETFAGGDKNVALALGVTLVWEVLIFFVGGGLVSDDDGDGMVMLLLSSPFDCCTIVVWRWFLWPPEFEQEEEEEQAEMQMQCRCNWNWWNSKITK